MEILTLSLKFQNAVRSGGGCSKLESVSLEMGQWGVGVGVGSCFPEEPVGSWDMREPHVVGFSNFSRENSSKDFSVRAPKF